MTIKDAILATVTAESIGEVRGRTILQKKLYFLSVLLGEDFGFVPHYYGPYSATVADELGALRDAGFIEEQIDVRPDSTGTFGERRRYRYRLDPSAQGVLTKRSRELEKYSSALQRINSHPLAKNADLLPVAAKVHFVVARRGHATVNEIRQRAGELGWDLNERQIGQVIEYLQHLGLAAMV